MLAQPAADQSLHAHTLSGFFTCPPSACSQDVVTANPDSWSFDPFKLTVEGDKLLGRGVTDCLGHVALLTELFRQLGQQKPPLKATVMGVFIANEENSTVGQDLRDPG